MLATEPRQADSVACVLMAAHAGAAPSLLVFLHIAFEGSFSC